MSDLNPHLAPLSQEKIQAMAVEFYGNGPLTSTVKNATEFAQMVLREAERLFQVWRDQQMCAMKGHQFDLTVNDLQSVSGDAVGDIKLTGWKVEEIKCANCDTRLVQQKTLV